MQHGTLTCYHYYKCRCAECAEAAREYSRQYYARRHPNARVRGSWQGRLTRRQQLDAIVASEGTDDCVLCPFPVAGPGYGLIDLGGRKRMGAHRYVCAVVHGNPPSDIHEAAHNCGIKACVNPRHLRWATPAENQADRLIHGTHTRGERYGAAKLTEVAVRAIRERVASGERQAVLAAEFGVSQPTISDVASRRSWWWLG